LDARLEPACWSRDGVLARPRGSETGYDFAVARRAGEIRWGTPISCPIAKRASG